jgi:hypothetical protein
LGFYAYDKPLAGARFCGREVLLRTLRDGLRLGRSFALGGGPKSGRTSLLAQLHHVLREPRASAPRQALQAPIYFDGAASVGPLPVAVARAWWDALLRGARNAAIESGGLPPLAPTTLEKRCPEPWKVLRSELVQLERVTIGTSAWSRHVWLIDNADHLLAHGRDDEAAFVRDLMAGAILREPAAVVLAGGRTLHESFAETKSPFPAARPINVGLFNEREAQALIHLGLPRLDPGLVETLLSLTGRHPYVLQRLLAELELQQPHYNLDAAVAAAQSDLEALWQAVWEQIDLGRDLCHSGTYAAPEHALMQFLTESAAPVELHAAERALGLKPLRETADLFEYLGVAERVLLGDARMIRAHVALWNGWYGDRVRG